MEMNRVDILSVKERGFLMRKPTASFSTSSRSLEGLSLRQKNVQKAQAFGVKMVPTFAVPPPPTQPAPQKTRDHQETAFSSNQNPRQSIHNGQPQVNRNYGSSDDSQVYHRLTSPREQDLTATYVADNGSSRQRAFVEVSLQIGQPNRDAGSESSSRIPRPAYTERHKAFDELQASLHFEHPPRSGELQARSRSRSFGHRLAAQVNVSTTRDQQRTRDLTDSYSKSHKTSSNSVVVAQPGASQLTQLGQHVFLMSAVEGEAGSQGAAAKQPPPRPPKSTGRSFFASRRNQKKISAQYEAVVEKKAEAKPEKKGFFNFKFPFGKGRVKELKAKMEQTASAPQVTEKAPGKPLPKPKRSPPNVKPKSYLPTRERAPPPKERAPPPPSEPAPPPPTELRASPYHHGTTESKTSPYRQGDTDSKSKTAPYHKTAIPKPYNSPQREDNSSPPSKIPPPTGPKTYVSKYRPQSKQATPSEVAAVNQSMSLYTCEEYLVPVRTQPTVDSPTSSGGEEHPPSPKAAPPGPGTSPRTQTSFAAKKLAAQPGSTMSLDSIAEAEEHEEKSPSPPAASEPLSELTPPIKQENSLLSPKIVSPGLAGRYNRLEPLSSLTSQNSLSNLKPATAGSIVSLDSALQDNTPSPSKALQPTEMIPTFRQKEASLQSLTSNAIKNSLTDLSASSMSLDSILEEFSKIGAPLTSDSEEAVGLDQATLTTEAPLLSNNEGEDGLDVASSKHQSPIGDRSTKLGEATSKTVASRNGNKSENIQNLAPVKGDAPQKATNRDGDTSFKIATSSSDSPQKRLVSNSDKEMTTSDRETSRKMAPTKLVTPRKPLFSGSDGETSLNMTKSKLKAPRKHLSSTSDGETRPNLALSRAKPPLKPLSSTSDGETRSNLALSRLKAPRKPLSSTSDGETRSNLALNRVKTPLKPLSSTSDGESKSNVAISRVKTPLKPVSSTSDGEIGPNFVSSRIQAPLQPPVSNSEGYSTSNQEEKKTEDTTSDAQKRAPVPKPRRKSRRRERLPSDSELTSSVPAPVPQNLVKLKSLANSADNLISEVTVKSTSEYSLGSGLRRPSVATNHSVGRKSPVPKVESCSKLFIDRPAIFQHRSFAALISSCSTLCSYYK